MEYVDGTVYWDHMLPKCSPEERALIYKNKNKVIASLHSVDYKKVGLEDMGSLVTMLLDKLILGQDNILPLKLKISMK